MNTKEQTLAGCFRDKEEEAEYALSFINALTVASDSEPEICRELFSNFIIRCELTIKSKKDYPLSKILWVGMLEPIEWLAFLLAWFSAVNGSIELALSKSTLSPGKSSVPTARLCLDLASTFLEDDEIDSKILFDKDSFLNRVLLEQNVGQTSSELNTPLVLRHEALLYIEGNGETLGDISLCANYLCSNDSNCNIHKSEEKELLNIFLSCGSSDVDSVVFLVGEKGIGKRFLVKCLLNHIQKKALSVDVSRLLSFSEKNRNAILSDIAVKLVLNNCILYLYNLPADRSRFSEVRYMFAILQSYFSVIIVGTENKPTKEIEAMVTGKCYQVQLTEPGCEDMKLIWQEATTYYGSTFADDIDVDELVSKYFLNAGRIFDSVLGAFPFAKDKQIDKKSIEKSIRSICAASFGDIAKRITSPFTWDDLKIEEDSKKLLELVCNRVKCKSRVNDDFGFGQKLPYGKGLAIVLYGPPGTGKTMAASVLANELSLDLYRIDLSQISSKYIGETEKNLGALFEAARNSNGILFFDEADSLFAKRTEVSSSNDKHANAETAYLLQKIEEYPGVSILATNNLQNFDVAFKRRMTYIIPIGMPDEKTREELWKAAFPDKAPLASDVNFSILAEAIEISGSGIKNAAIEAAYRAAAENRKITMNDILDAVDLECMKNGMMGVKNEIISKLVTG